MAMAAALLLFFAALCLVVPGLACSRILPADSAQVNYNTIMGCLQSEQQASLGPGRFLLPHGLRLPRNTSLFGVPPNASAPQLTTRLVLAVPTAITHYVLQLGSYAEASWLSLDAAEYLRGEGCCKCIVCVYGNFSQVSGVEVTGTSTGAGVYFENPTAHGNVAREMYVHGCFYGVIFAAGLSARQRNAFEHGTIEDVRCDAVSFAGYGEVHHSSIRRSGFACSPDSGTASSGAGFFCRGNWEGATIHSNQVMDTCGMALDVDSCSHLDVFNNTFSGPGYDWDGNITHCWGALTAAVLDSQRCSVTHNLMRNERASNRVGLRGADRHQVFSEVAAQPFSDLPSGPETVLNFALLHRPHAGAWPSINNEIANNSFTSRCPPGGENATCLGIAYFAGRGTGLEGIRLPGYSLGARAPKQPSRFTGNKEDADVGSERCGENWYAAEEPVCRLESDFPCNADDYQHPQENLRNSLLCRDYSDVIHVRSVTGPAGTLRQPMPIEAGRPMPGPADHPEAWEV